MMDFQEFADFLAASTKRVRKGLTTTAAEIGVVQVKEAQVEIIGHELKEWAPLADSTVEEKERLGYTGQVSATDPLLRSGALRDSVSYKIEQVVTGVALTLGSTDKIAVYQEIGTSHIPARPFLATATIRSLAVAQEKLSKTAVALLAPTKGISSL